MIGYANYHGGNVYRMFNPFTGRVSETRDVIWLQRMLYERENTEATRLEPIVALEVSREIVEEQDTILEGGVIVQGTVKKEEPEDRESDDRSVSSGDSTDDEKDDFVEVRTRAGREVKPVPIYNPTDGKSYGNIAAAHNFYACL